MTVKKLFLQIHRWVGLLSGIIVFLVCLTGVVWALNIYGWVGADRTRNLPVEGNASDWLLPSELKRMAVDSLGFEPTYLSYTQGAPALVAKYSFPRRTAYVNPFTGQEIKADEQSTSSAADASTYTLWQWAREGHRHLWLPRHIGAPLVNYGTLAFVLTLLSGLIIWWPKRMKYLWKQLRIGWNTHTSWHTIGRESHVILGMYVLPVLLVIGLTGMVWGLSWWADGTYWLTTGGKRVVPFYAAQSDTTQAHTRWTADEASDRIFLRTLQEHPQAPIVEIALPDANRKASTISISLPREKGKYYNSARYTYDRYTLQRIVTGGPYDGSYEELSWGDKLRRMNYELHVGSVLGLTGQILVFVAALIGTTLPLTGYYLYVRKHRRKSARQSTKGQ